MPTIRRILLIALALGLVACGEETLEPAASGPSRGAGQATRGKATKGYLGIPAGKIVYKRTGVPSGTITIWFEDHGGTVVYDEDTRYKKMRNHKRIIWRDGTTTMHDYETGETTTPPLRVRATELGWNPTVSEENLARVGYEKQGTETLLGLECVLWVNPKQKVKAWVYEKLPIKEIIGSGYTLEATAFERLEAIPPEAFAIPGA